MDKIKTILYVILAILINILVSWYVEDVKCITHLKGYSAKAITSTETIITFIIIFIVLLIDMVYEKIKKIFKKK